MQIMNISNHQFRKMKEYVPDNEIGHMECKLYLLKDKDKWNKNYKLFKKFNKTEGEYFSSKLYTINELINNKDKIEIEELVYPDKLISLDNEIAGYSMDFIKENININKILNSDKIDFKFKIKILKEIGLLLEKIKNNGIITLSDIHEGNFIYDLSRKQVRAIDLDSCKIGKNEVSLSKYLTFNHNLWDYPHKYPLNEDDIHIPNTNTTYLSYIYMILNFISGTNYISELSIDSYYKYLERLKQNGFNQELLDIFSLIYVNTDNKNPVDLLDRIQDKKINCKGLLR